MRSFDTGLFWIGPVSTSSKMAVGRGVAEKKKEVMDWRQHLGTTEGTGGDSR